MFDYVSATVNTTMSSLCSKFDKLDVINVYNTIASSFSKTRVSHWDRVAQFIMDLPAGYTLGDIGCGNGKYFDVRTDIEIMACDASIRLVEICSDRIHDMNYTHVDVFHGDVRNIPIMSGILDAVICVAVIHHLHDYNERIEAVCELFRVIRRGGCILFTMWAEVDMENRKETHKWTPLDNKGDYLIPWTLTDNHGGRTVHHRYYHLMDAEEAERMREDILQELQTRGDGRAHVSCDLEQNNWNFIVTKSLAQN